MEHQKHQTTQAGVGWLADIATLLFVVLAGGAYLHSVMDDRGASSVELSVPTVVDDFSVTDVAGQRFAPLSAYDDEPLLLFIFQVQCPYCNEQKTDWLNLASVARSNGVRTLAITSQSMSPNIASYFGASPDVEVLSSVEPELLASKLGTPGVPSTILLNSERRPIFHRVGLMDDRMTTDLQVELGRFAGLVR